MLFSDQNLLQLDINITISYLRTNASKLYDKHWSCTYCFVSDPNLDNLRRLLPTVGLSSTGAFVSSTFFSSSGDSSLYTMGSLALLTRVSSTGTAFSGEISTGGERIGGEASLRCFLGDSSSLSWLELVTEECGRVTGVILLLIVSVSHAHFIFPHERISFTKYLNHSEIITFSTLIVIHVLLSQSMRKCFMLKVFSSYLI